MLQSRWDREAERSVAATWGAQHVSRYRRRALVRRWWWLLAFGLGALAWLAGGLVAATVGTVRSLGQSVGSHVGLLQVAVLASGAVAAVAAFRWLRSPLRWWNH